MNIFRKVAVKAKMTDKLKKIMVEELQEVISRLDGDIKKLEDKMELFVKELTKNNPGQAVVMRQQMSLEKEQIIKKQETIKFKISEIMNTKNGEIINQGTVESIVEVKVGDDMSKILTESEIIVEDGVILEIR